MKIIARQLTIDFYNCNVKKLQDKVSIMATVNNIIGDKIQLKSDKISEKHFGIIGAFDEGHLAIHVYEDLKYVSVDVYTCSDSNDPELFAKDLKKYFQPEKIKSTFLKRGDFGQERDIKPKIKTRVAPIRKIRSAGAKVFKTLTRTNKQ